MIMYLAWAANEEQEWRGFNSRTRRHMWVEFIVGSHLCSEGFSPGTPVFLPPQKPTFPNSAFERVPWELFGAPWVKKLHYITI